jgi:hypothetical protein
LYHIFSRNPGQRTRRHVNLDAETNAVLYALTDTPLLLVIGHYRAQGRTERGDMVDLAA